LSSYSLTCVVRQMNEHQHQVSLFKWANMQAATMPELALMFAIPNGGQRNIIVATRLKAEGVKSGVPDIFLPVARGGAHGLFIELKTEKGKPSGNQREWIGDLNFVGYCAVFCYGWEHAKDTILEYLKGV